MGARGATYRNCKRLAINDLEEQMCEKEGVGFLDLWGYVVGKDMYVRERAQQFSLRTCFDPLTVEQVATI